MLALMLVMACRQSYPTMIYEEPETSLDELNKDYSRNSHTPILLFVNPQDFFSITATRGSGPFPPADLSAYQDGTIYVYAFRSDYNIQGTVLTALPSLRNTAYAIQNKPYGIANDSIDLTDCLLDGRDYHLGVPTKLVRESSGELIYNYHYEKDAQGQDVLTYGNKLGREFYYSNVYQEIPYNFFAYYVDDFKPNASNTHREDTHIHYDITIDGRRDIMCGMAPDLNKVIASRYSQQFKKLTAAEQATIRNIGGYSKFTADRDIHPSIDVKHQLTRLEFVAYPAGGTSTNDIIITGIDVNCKTHADLTVATRDTVNYPLGLQFYGSPNRLPLKMEYPDTLRGDKGVSYAGYLVRFKPEMEKQEWYERESVQIGENLILPSDSTFEIVIHAAQKIVINEKGDGAIIPFDSPKTIRLTGDDKIFKPGYIYTINMAVYGRQKIEVFTSIEQWKKGADVFLDDEDGYY